MRRAIFFCFLLAGLAMTLSRAQAQLRADQLLLIVNKNEPAGARLAGLYGQLRQVPPDRIVALDLPNQEEMGFDTYETGVVGPVRQFITDHQLEDQIKCLVTFYGVPFRITDKVNTHDETDEQTALITQRGELWTKANPFVNDLEIQAAKIDPDFKPAAGLDTSGLGQRLNAAIKVVGQHINQIPDPEMRADALQQFNRPMEELGGTVLVDQHEGAEPAIHQKDLQSIAEYEKLELLRWDASARVQLRQLAAESFGLLGHAHVLDEQIDYFNTKETGSATDSELALLWWGYYPHARWLPNPLHYGMPAPSRRAIMVMRLDGPNPDDVLRMIHTSVDVESAGLSGTVAIDARGIAAFDAKGQPDNYGTYDEKLRHLAEMLRSKTHLNVVLDNKPEVFAPHSVNDVALYCGWYSLANYVPGCNFNPGAVGFHVASFEMVKLHGQSSQWVHGLIGSGCVATLGAVAEPYLTAFPNPDDFFPLLLTGKLTLAEVCWKTNPMASWMISFIGDPLYTPYKVHPELQVDDLPQILRSAIPHDTAR